MKNDKCNRKIVVLLILLYLGLFALFSLLFVNAFFKIKLFFDIPYFFLPIMLGVAALASAIFLCLVIPNKKRENRFTWFMKNHVSGILLSFAFLNIFIGCINNELSMDFNKASNLVNLEWTIYAVSIGAFAVWHGLVFMRLINSNKGENAEGCEDKNDEYGKRRQLRRKSLNHMTIAGCFEPVVLIILNTIFNVLATGILYFSKEYKLVQESIIICALFFTTNTLIDVLLNIVIQLVKERRMLLNETRVDYSELNDVEDYIKAKEFIDAMEKQNQTKPFNYLDYDDQKKRMIIERVCFFLDTCKKDNDAIKKNFKEIASLAEMFKSAFKKYKFENKTI